MSYLCIMDENIYIKETPGCETGIWILPEVYYDETQPVGFKNWTKTITYCGNTATFPNGSKAQISAYITLTGQFDYGAYTNFLLTMYETNG